MAHIHHPLIGDPVYGERLKVPKGATPALITALRQFKRQALHAARLALVHPVTEKLMEWKSGLPADMQELVRCLREDGEK
jgi:23S rRNA pseudouridine1911/1915/1917 synthase